VKQGKLVSDDVVFDLLSKRLVEESRDGEQGFILDGFPRTCGQAVRFYISECL
jgi:adenylate kinase